MILEFAAQQQCPIRSGCPDIMTIRMRHTARSQIPHTQSFRIRLLLKQTEAKKKELVNEYQQLLWDEMPLVMLYNGYIFGVQSERFQGYNAFEGGVNNQAVWKWSVKE